MSGPPRDLWPRLEPILAHALELEPEARTAYLEEACAGDARLRREVEAILEADNEAEGLLSGALGEFAATLSQELGGTPEFEASELTGRVEIGRYRVVRELGRGGMGVVYEAEDPRLERRVALKLLPAEMASDPERQRRFEREAKVVAALNHPNVVTLHSVEQAEVPVSTGGEISGRTARVRFLTMELVEGKTLTEMIPRRGFDLETLLDLAVPLADAVAAAHAKGITHRDLKPANIMVDGDGRVKILDFGLARILESLGGATSQLQTLYQTAAGRVLGTPLYMSPEQVRGEPVDHRADIFSLGIVLYEMATGEKPFQGGSQAEVSSAILRDEPSAVAERRADLPRHLGRIISHCLVKAPEGRYQSAKDVSNELLGLRREMESERILERARALPGGVPRAGRRRTLLVLLAVAAVVAGVSYLAPWRERLPVPSREAPTPAAAEEKRKMIVVLPFENLGPPEQEYFAAGMTEEITSRLAMVRSLGVISRTSAVQYDRTGKSLREIGADLGVDYVLEGTVRWAASDSGPARVRFTPQLSRVVDDTHLWAGRYDQTLDDIFAVQSEIAVKVSEELGVTLELPEREALEARPTENLEAYHAYLRGRTLLGRIDTGVRDRPVAAESFERAVEHDPGFVLAWAELAVVRSRLYFSSKDPVHRQAAQQALERAAERAPDTPEVDLAEAYYNYYVERNFDRALELLARIDEARPNDAEALELMGYILRLQGHWEEAREALERAAELNPQDLWLLGRLASFVLLPLERYAEAMELADLAIARGPDQRILYDMKAAFYWVWKGDTEAARAALETLPARDDYSRLMDYYQEVYEGNYAAALESLAAADPDWVEGNTFGRWPKPLLEAWVRELQQRPDLAEPAYERALRLAEDQLRRDSESWKVHSVLGYVYAGLGRKQEAIRAAKRAVEINSHSEDPAWDAVDPIKHLAIVYTRLGEHEAALDLLEHLLRIPFEKISIPYVQLEPWWEPLRGHPRYLELVEGSNQG